MRIVSLLPAATEVLHLLGAGDEVVGVTFECDTPATARSTARVVSASTLPEGLDPAGIDSAVRERVAAGEDLYRLDADALAGLDADLVVTQDLCAVCAVDVTTVDAALSHLGCRAEVLTTDPHTLEEVLEAVGTVGTAVGRSAEAAALIASLRQRLAALPGPGEGPRVAVLEWTDPPYAPGHWIPEMVAIAGGTNVLGAAGARSVVTTFEVVAAARPDVVVVAPCGYDAASAATQAKQVLDRLPPQAQVWAVDANAAFARPGPRLVDGCEALAALLHGGTPDPSLAVPVRL